MFGVKGQNSAFTNTMKLLTYQARRVKQDGIWVRPSPRTVTVLERLFKG